MAHTNALGMTMSALETGFALHSAGARVIQVAPMLVQKAAKLMRPKMRVGHTSVSINGNAKVKEPAQLGAGAKVPTTAIPKSHLIYAKSMRPQMRVGHTSVRPITNAEAKEPARLTAGAKVTLTAPGQSIHAESMRRKITMGNTSVGTMTNAKAKEPAHPTAGAKVKLVAIHVIPTRP